ncbi:MAG: hypothetical protein Q9179_006954 [Wetmoreana sp. 5 TL-2023]
MCLGTKTTFPGCGHYKLEMMDPCKYGYTNGMCNNRHVTLTRESFSHAPSVCCHCYRRKVDDIIASYKRKIMVMDEEIEKRTVKLRAVTSNGEREKLKKDRSDLEVKRGEYIDRRIADLEEFRIQQGIWGDGGKWKGYSPFGIRDKS